jgi:hypothetical protein
MGIVFLAVLGMVFMCCSDGGDGTESPDLSDSTADVQTDDVQPDGGVDSEELDSDAESTAPCQWDLANPGDLVATGAEDGYVVDNATFVDQCNNTVDLWDFAGKYRVIFLTAAW